MPGRRTARRGAAGIAAALGATFLAAIGLLGLAVLAGGAPCPASSAGQDGASAAAIAQIPARMLAVYEQVGAQYNLPWEILAAIGRLECDHGQNPDPSCTPQPGAHGLGAANYAGASGPMQIGIGGAAGQTFQSIESYLPAA
ncbi:MAG: hypothetical protein M3Z95_04070, partial [Actinomycetota bacterium]|nr:hypothetical protein [Actinomycetota bacterium]